MVDRRITYHSDFVFLLVVTAVMLCWSSDIAKGQNDISANSTHTPPVRGAQIQKEAVQDDPSGSGSDFELQKIGGGRDVNTGSGNPSNIEANFSSPWRTLGSLLIVLGGMGTSHGIFTFFICLV